ncbi:MAG: GerMN domain-containing protein [Lapillicoccus sp.]
MRERPAAVSGLVIVLVAAVTLLGACGLPRSSTPVKVPPAEVPYGLLQPATAGPTPTLTPGVLLVPGTIYLVDAQQKLVSVGVQVPAAPAGPMLQTLLNRLTVGPSDRERAGGLVTDLGPGSTIVLRNISAGTANIELQTENQDPSPSKLPVAVGQIVLTATSIVGVDRVVFVRDGTVLPVPGPDGSTTSDPLTSAAYPNLVAPGQPPVERTVPLPGAAAPSTTTSP